mmetsp:Transcript_3438/g.8163  ORF Transcript_3438/g.8163 Transcript_3438/m.8163 type:complete len:543 (-) Transcript_3438:105-1733(-)
MESRIYPNDEQILVMEDPSEQELRVDQTDLDQPPFNINQSGGGEHTMSSQGLVTTADVEYLDYSSPGVGYQNQPYNPEEHDEQQQQQQHSNQFAGQYAQPETSYTSDTDLTSTAGYTLSGNHDRRQRFQQAQQELYEQNQNQEQERSEYQIMNNPSPGSSRASYKKKNDPMNDARKSEPIKTLCSQGFTFGLAKALMMNTNSFEQRIWIVDNSGSMEIDDGQKIVVREDGRVDIKSGVSRWEELQDTVLYHADIAATIGSYTCFRLLNDPGQVVGRQQVVVGGNEKNLCLGESAHKTNIMDQVLQVHHVMTKARPEGVTPLTEHMKAVEFEIREMLPRLQASGKRISVILATDGLPSDAQGYGGPEITQDFINSLRALEGLPVWMVIRLCTDEEDVTEFYNNLDNLLDFSLEVLDDFRGEFEEVTEMNPWLNYGLPIHRCRELGYHDRLFDMIDERPLTKGELREFCVLLFGTDIDDIPDPVIEWESFVRYVEEKLQNEKLQWNPIQKKMKPWINVKKMKRMYGPKGPIQRWFLKTIHVTKS